MLFKVGKAHPTLFTKTCDGDLFVCPNVPRRKELIQGNIRTDNFKDVWDNKYKEFRDKNRTACSKCKKCDSNYYLSNNFNCIFDCPYDLYYYNYTCRDCPKNLFEYLPTQSCVASCPSPLIQNRKLMRCLNKLIITKEDNYDN